MSNLLEKASILLTPTAYDDGSILSVKPIDGSGDFDFTRGSSATRVNEKGLIQDVQLLSGELVQNGNFEQIGSELVTNGSFDTDSDWSKGTGWSISDGKAVAVLADNTNLQQNQNTVANKTYKVVYTVSDYQNGSVRFQFHGGGGNTIGTDVNANGTYTEYMTPTFNHTIYRFKAKSDDGGFTGSIDNVSVKEVGQNWTFVGTASISDGKATINSPSGELAEIYQSSVLTIGNKYKLECTLDKTSGDTQFVNGGTFILDNGSNTIEFIATDTRVYFKRGAGSVISSIDNVSVIEITDDTDLPRIDYTNGTGSLLLEPQSTNLITYSEQFDNAAWDASSDVLIESGYLAPDGTNNAYKITKNGNNSKVALFLFGTAPFSKSIYARTVSGTGTAYFGEGYFTGVLSTVTEQWQRFEITVNDNNFYGVDFRGGSTLTEVLIWGAQLEELSYATSYIPTNGSTVTRLQEAANGAGSSDLINSTEGVLYAEIKLGQAYSSSRYIALSNGGTSNRVIFGVSAMQANTITWFIGSGGQVNGTATGIDFSIFNKIALKYSENNVALWINGVKVNTNLSVSMPTGLNTLEFNQGGSGNLFFGKTKCVAVFKEALTDDELECLTSDETSFSSFNALALANNYTII